jgi:TPR repeat protein
MKTKSLLALLSVGLCLLVQPAASGEYEDGVASLRTTQYAVALRLWQPLAEQGDARAQNQLGFLYLKGFGVNQDYAEAAKWFRLAADQGFAAAEFYLGVMYEDGLGVRQDYVVARNIIQPSSSRCYV